MNYVTLVLIDKGYFDYDYEKVEKPVMWEDTVKSDEEVADMLAGFGIWGKKPKSDEELQQFIINEEKKKQDGCRNSGNS